MIEYLIPSESVGWIDLALTDPFTSIPAEVTGWSINIRNETDELRYDLKSINIKIQTSKVCSRNIRQPIICAITEKEETVGMVCIGKCNKRQ